MIRGKNKSCFFFKNKLIDLKKISYLFFDLKKIHNFNWFRGTKVTIYNDQNNVVHEGIYR